MKIIAIDSFSSDLLPLVYESYHTHMLENQLSIVEERPDHTHILMHNDSVLYMGSEQGCADIMQSLTPKK